MPDRRHRFVIPIPRTYEMPLPARGNPKFNPNLQRLKDIAATAKYFENLPEDYYDEPGQEMEEINWDRTSGGWPNSLGVDVRRIDRIQRESRNRYADGSLGNRSARPPTGAGKGNRFTVTVEQL